MSRQAVAMLVHKDAAQVNALINILQKDFDVFIHIDRKADIRPEQINCSRVYKEIAVNWGGFDMIEAMVYLYRKILESKNPYTHVILLSGDSLPVKTNREIASFLSSNTDVSFLENIPADARHLERRKFYWYKEAYRNKMSLFDKVTHPFMVIRWFQQKLNLKRSIKGFERYGSQWTILALDHVKHLLAHGNFADYKYVAIPDESLVQNHFFNNNLPYRENKIYAHWPDKRSYSPDFISEESYAMLLKSEYLFARKFEQVAAWQHNHQDAVNERASSR